MGKLQRTTKTKTGKLQMEVQNGKEYDWIKIEEFIQPSTRIRKLQWIYMADGNFTTDHRQLGKKNGSQHDRNDRIVLLPRSAYPTWIHFYLTSRIPIKLRT
jgi:hypothetical protein